MHRLAFVVIYSVVTVCLTSILLAQDSNPTAKTGESIQFQPVATSTIPGKIVYVGASKRFARTETWLAFLRANFADVQHVRASQFRAEDFSSADAFIFDLEQTR